MNVNTKSLVSITEANQNFSKVARLVDENGSAVILKKQRGYLTNQVGQPLKNRVNYI